MTPCTCGGKMRRHQIDEVASRKLGKEVCRYRCYSCGAWARFYDSELGRKNRDRKFDDYHQPVKVAQ